MYFAQPIIMEMKGARTVHTSYIVQIYPDLDYKDIELGMIGNN